MELREINVEDVYPDEKNPRKDFGDIEALAESCMLNAVSPGEPVNPIVVVEDGGIYRIVDGERRCKAMRKNRLERCHAVVCGDLDEANAMVAMVATDDKQQLSEIERSRGVQQMLLLGVDPERVERAGRMPKGSAAKLRRARAAVDDAGDDMTLDRMMAIAEFDGDAEAVERLSSCRESEWRSVRISIKCERERKALVEALSSSCAGLGIALLDKAPRGARMREQLWNLTAENVGGRIEAEVDPAASIVVCKAESWGGCSVIVYDKPEDVSDSEAAKIASYNSQKRSMTSDKRRRAEFVGRLMLETGIEGLESTGALFAERAKSSGYDTAKFRERAGIDEVPMRASEWLVATKWEQLDGMTQDELAAIVNGKRKNDHRGYGKTAASTFLALVEALEADGYETSESEQALVSKCKKAIEEGE